MPVRPTPPSPPSSSTLTRSRPAHGSSSVTPLGDGRGLLVVEDRGHEVRLGVRDPHALRGGQRDQHAQQADHDQRRGSAPAGSCRAAGDNVRRDHREGPDQEERRRSRPRRSAAGSGRRRSRAACARSGRSSRAPEAGEERHQHEPAESGAGSQVAAAGEHAPRARVRPRAPASERARRKPRSRGPVTCFGHARADRSRHPHPPAGSCAEPTRSRRRTLAGPPLRGVRRSARLPRPEHTRAGGGALRRDNSRLSTLWVAVLGRSARCGRSAAGPSGQVGLRVEERLEFGGRQGSAIVLRTIAAITWSPTCSSGTAYTATRLTAL